MFAKLKASLTGASQRIAGRTDALEAIAAAAALVAAADGEIEDEEVAQTVTALQSNATLSAAFTAAQIGAAVDKMLARAGGGRAGRMGLYKEIDDIATQPDVAETVLLVALDVADSDGEMEPAEKKVIDQIAQRLGMTNQLKELMSV